MMNRAVRLERQVGFNKQKFPTPKQNYHDGGDDEGGEDEYDDDDFDNDADDDDPCSLMTHVAMMIQNIMMPIMMNKVNMMFQMMIIIQMMAKIQYTICLTILKHLLNMRQAKS